MINCNPVITFGNPCCVLFLNQELDVADKLLV
jgi:hypothetical protein